ncbi:RodZ domain-containing protein [Propionivibrio sp.]|uniref:RodZ domain-containing protein n=1 Tax=Propionivibrio sp. TaxID=2212460 RepID=UPI003BF3309D
MNRTPEASTDPMEQLALSVGQQLRAAREAKGLAADDVAKAIKLSLRQVEAIEADDWLSLPCNTIIRGFVRNYARLLGLNPDLLMTALDRLKMPQEPELEMPIGPTVSLPKEGKVNRRDYVRVLSGLIVLVLAVSAYFLVSEDLLRSTLSALKAATQSREVSAEKVVAPEKGEAKAPESAVAPPTGTLLADSSATPPVPSPPVSAGAPTPSNGLMFNFTQPSWVEVRDRSGEIIFSQLCQAGSQREIEGQPPFALVIGNSEHVTLQYQGRAVDLSKRSKDGVARLSLE